MKVKEYFLGLDIGTTSVGYAVTDTDYNLVKFKGDDLWGIRLFEQAQTAQNRRVLRNARRRRERQKQRIAWLQEVFDAEISKTDPGFFQRLKESKFRPEDKENSEMIGRYTLFNDADYTDSNFHEEYKTIYHLRKALIDDTCAADARLVYLAIHHIMKKRGHFIFSKFDTEEISLDGAIDELNTALENEYPEEGYVLFIENSEDLNKILFDSASSITERKRALKELFQRFISFKCYC